MYFRDIVGQHSLREKLAHSYKQGRLGHAILFDGKEGYGTLPLALALARYIVCNNPGHDDSCGVCPACKKFDKLIHPDVHFVFPVINKKGKETISDSFIDEWRRFVRSSPYSSYFQWIKTIASESKQGGIFKDESDSINRKLSLKSFESQYKIVIIWSTDKMNDSAANKILKILEEPPDNTFFFLTTAHSEQILPTIRSRTQIVNVGPIDASDIENFLVENKAVPRDVAHKLALFSDGDLEAALDYIDRREEFAQNTRHFADFINHAKSQNYAELLAFIEGEFSKNRTRQTEFLQYALHLVRQQLHATHGLLERAETLTQNNPLPPLSYTEARQVYELLQKAIVHIERNLNAKIVLLDTAIKLGKILV